MKIDFKSKNFKSVVAIALAAVLLITGGFGSFFMLSQPDSAVNDQTVAENSDNSGDSGDGGRKDPQALISPTVTMLEGDTAAAVNKSITKLSTTSLGTYITAAEGTALDDLGVGDVFFLDGSETTPIGEPYFGKVKSTKTVNGSTTLMLETPMIDEVFDSLCLNTENILDENPEATFQALDGVTVTSGGETVTGSIGKSPAVTNLSTAGSSPQISALGSAGGSLTTKKTKGEKLSFNPKERLDIKIEVDLLEAYKKIRGNDEDEPFEKGSNSTKVYATEKGKVYHEKDCFQIKKSKNVKTFDLSAVDGKKKPCQSCKPKVLTNTSAKPNLTLTGAVGIENLLCDVYFDWDILSGNGINDFTVNVSGDAFFEVKVEGNGELKLGGNDTEWSSPGEFVKLQGLKEKMFPIGYISLTQGVTCTYAGGNNSIVRAQVSVMPVSILVMVYVDLQGNVTFGVEMSAKVTRPFNYEQTFVKNGKIQPKGKLDLAEAETTWSVEAGIEGDADAHVGLSALVYVFNLNLADIAILKVGAEAEGKLALTVNQDTVKGTEPWYEASFYSRIYLKLLDIKLLLRASLDFFGVVSASGSIDVAWTLLDMTLAEWGARLPTRYSDEIMTYSLVTARDDKATYYKDEEGRLMMDKDGFRKVLYDEEFFIICGIDESYIYILKNNGDHHAMYRVSKDNSTAKEVVNDVSRVLHFDDEFIYFVDTFDDTVIRKFDRAKETTAVFADFDHKVEYMQKQDLGLYVVTSDIGPLSWFIGGANEYFVLDKKGKIIREYGENPEVAELCLDDMGNFYQASKIVTGGTLRHGAEALYWLSEDKTQHVEAIGASGWNAEKNGGIFCTEANHDYSSADRKPYNLIVYRAKDGAKEIVTGVYSDQVNFTVVQSPAGDWFFFDQTNDALVLYSLDENLKNQRIVKSFSLSELSFNLTECGTSILDNCLYFYTVKDEKVCEVLKRIDIY